MLFGMGLRIVQGVYGGERSNYSMPSFKSSESLNTTIPRFWGSQKQINMFHQNINYYIIKLL